MGRDLDIPIRVVAFDGAGKDGFVIPRRSSSSEEPAIAPRLPEVLIATAKHLVEGAGVDQTLEIARTMIVRSRLHRPARLLVAAWLGDTRLIDNVEFGHPSLCYNHDAEVGAKPSCP